MATKKNFTIENYNGTDYDTLYPQTNSAQVLLDKTAQDDLGLGGQTSNPTLDDACEKLGNVIQFDNRYEIGDTITTSRTNLSDKWLLCNGASLSGDDYPELSTQFSSSLCNFSLETTMSNYATSAQLAVRERNGIVEALVCTTDRDSSSNNRRLYYINISGGMSAQQISTNYEVIAVANNVFFRYYGSTIYYCDANSDPTSSSSWQTLLTSIGTFVDVVYLNGKYCVASSGQLYFYDSLSNTPIKPSAQTYSSMAIGLDGDNILMFYSGIQSSQYYTNYYIYNTNGVLVNTIKGDTSELKYGMISRFGNGYVNIYTDSGTSSSASTITVKYQSSLATVGSTITTDNGPSGQYRNITISHDSIVDDLYIPLANNKYIDLGRNINAFGKTVDKPIIAYSATDNNLYALAYNSYSSMSIYESSKFSVFNLPTYSPTTGLRAYIKAKN